MYAGDRPGRAGRRAGRRCPSWCGQTARTAFRARRRGCRWTISARMGPAHASVGPGRPLANAGTEPDRRSSTRGARGLTIDELRSPKAPFPPGARARFDTVGMEPPGVEESTPRGVLPATAWRRPNKSPVAISSERRLGREVIRVPPSPFSAVTRGYDRLPGWDPRRALGVVTFFASQEARAMKVSSDTLRSRWLRLIAILAAVHLAGCGSGSSSSSSSAGSSRSSSGASSGVILAERRPQLRAARDRADIEDRQRGRQRSGHRQPRLLADPCCGATQGRCQLHTT